RESPGRAPNRMVLPETRGTSPGGGVPVGGSRPWRRGRGGRSSAASGEVAGLGSDRACLAAATCGVREGERWGDRELGSGERGGTGRGRLRGRGGPGSCGARPAPWDRGAARVGTREELGEGVAEQLADPLLGQPQVATDLLEAHRRLASQAVARGQDGALAAVQAIEPPPQRLALLHFFEPRLGSFL